MEPDTSSSKTDSNIYFGTMILVIGIIFLIFKIYEAFDIVVWLLKKVWKLITFLVS